VQFPFFFSFLLFLRRGNFDGPSFVERVFHGTLFQQQKSQVFCWDGRRNSKWHKLDNIRVELPTQTLLEVELVMELRGEVRIVHYIAIEGSVAIL